MLAEGPSGRPLRVDLGGGHLAVTEVVERWEVEVGWWRVGPRRWERRCCWRVLLEDGRCLDLYRDRGDGEWQLARCWG